MESVGLHRITIQVSTFAFFCSVEGIENDIQEIQESLASRLTGANEAHSDSNLPDQSADLTLTENSNNDIPAACRQDIQERLAALQRAFRTSSEQKVG